MYFFSWIKGFPYSVLPGKRRRSFPKGLGRGSILELEKNQNVRDHAIRFIEGIPLSGPVAVEFKEDQKGQLWLIEPTVGRTEYCVDVNIQGKLNLPFMEYYYSLNKEFEYQWIDEALNYDVIWYDTEVEPTCYIERMSSAKNLKTLGKNSFFSFLGAWRFFAIDFGICCIDKRRIQKRAGMDIPSDKKSF